MKRRTPLFAFAGTLAIGVATPALAADVTVDELMNDQSTPGDVLTYGMGPRGQRYSSLDAINTETIENLFPVWSFSFGGEKQRGQESQPLVKDGVMYVTGSYSRMWAIDVETGEELWQYDARLPEGILPCCDVINRGAAILGDKVFFGTLDAKMVALDKATGKVVWRKKIADYQDGYSYTAAPADRAERGARSAARHRQFRRRVRRRRADRREEPRDRRAGLDAPRHRGPHGYPRAARRAP